jgi:hypothetical protein
VRDHAHPHFAAAIDAGTPLWRLSVKSTAPHADHGGEQLIEWGGALRWFKTDVDPAVVRHDFERAGFEFDGSSGVLAHPADDHTRLVFDEAIRGKTDQFVYRFRKPTP